MDKFLEMTVFSAVAAEGSFSRAAQRLQMSRPTISRHVAALEERLKARLIQRSTRHFSLTIEGKAFEAKCVEALAIVEDAESELTGGTALASGLLRVTIPSSFGVHFLAPVWPGFIALYSGVTLDIDLSDRSVDLVEDGFDVGLRIGEKQTPDLVRRKLATMRMTLCASPDLLARHGSPQHPWDLARFPTAAIARSTGSDYWEFVVDGSILKVDIKPRIRTSSGEINRATALLGQAIVLEPNFLVESDLRAGSLVEILPDFPSPERAIYIVYPSKKHLSPKVRSFINFVSGAFEGGLLPRHETRFTPSPQASAHKSFK